MEENKKEISVTLTQREWGKIIYALSLVPNDWRNQELISNYGYEVLARKLATETGARPDPDRV